MANDRGGGPLGFLSNRSRCSAVLPLELPMPRRPPTIPQMGVLSRLIFVCALALLQLAPASGHVLHHALEGAGPEHRDCTDATCRMDQDPPATCDHGPDADPPVQHDCDNCFLCDASAGQIARVTRQHCPIEDAATAYPLSALVAPEPLDDSARRLPPAPPPPRPATFHAVTLPLLD